MSLSIQQEIEKCDWYHTIELPGYITKGRYDWRPYLHKFGLDDLAEKTVLDVGAGNGYFSFEFEKAGASVTALDIPSQQDRDNNALGMEDKSTYQYNYAGFNSAFSIAKRLLNSNVNRVEMNLYDLSPDNVGTFDIVFCNDVLLHLTDPLRALCAFRRVCNGSLVVGTPLFDPALFWARGFFHLLKRFPFVHFVGATNSTAFYLPTATCLEHWVTAAGFKVVKSTSIKPDKELFEYPQTRGIVTARPEGTEHPGDNREAGVGQAVGILRAGTKMLLTP